MSDLKMNGLCEITCRYLALVLIFTLPCVAENEATALAERATYLSDIRASDAPAFNLTADLTLYGKDDTVTGTYTEHWLSDDQWRREVVAGNARRLEVGQGKKRWVLVSGKTAPLREPENVLRVWKFNPDEWKVDKIHDRTLEDKVVRCLDTRPDPKGGISALCFDRVTGTLTAKIVPNEQVAPIGDRTCVYSDYQPFAGKQFPHHVACYDQGKQTLDLRVTALLPLEGQNTELFNAPSGAVEMVNCHDFIKAPTPIFTPDPEFPRRETQRNPVVLWIKVSQDGKVQDVKVIKSIDKAFDEAAVHAVSRWKFKPATCQGGAVDSEINVEVSFRLTPFAP